MRASNLMSRLLGLSVLLLALQPSQLVASGTYSLVTSGQSEITRGLPTYQSGINTELALKLSSSLQSDMPRFTGFRIDDVTYRLHTGESDIGEFAKTVVSGSTTGLTSGFIGSMNAEVDRITDFNTAFESGTIHSLTASRHLAESGAYGWNSDNGPRLEGTHDSRFMNAISTRPGYGFLASLALPGISQAANRQYWKTGLMVAVEATAIYFLIDASNRGRRLENRYQRIGDDNWSVVQYASWLHDYHHNKPGAREPGSADIPPEQLLTPAGIANVNPATGFPDPVFDTSREWNWINLGELNNLERRTIHPTTGNFFTHVVNPFGSQQYYELMSKYQQFGPGWRDWNSAIHNVDGTINDMPQMWLDHARLEFRFNSAFRVANHMVSLIAMNHVLSAFDAYFTIKLREHRLETMARADYLGTHVYVNWRF